MQIRETITGTEPLTVAEVKLYLKVDFTTDDTMIGYLITSVRESVERFTGLSLIEKTIEYFNDEIEPIIKLPYPEHEAITEVKINGSVSTAYVKTGLTQFILKINDTSISTSDEFGIKVTYTTTGRCQQGIKFEILKTIDEKYRNRGNSFEGSIAELSENSYANLAKYCMM